MCYGLSCFEKKLLMQNTFLNGMKSIICYYCLFFVANVDGLSHKGVLPPIYPYPQFSEVSPCSCDLTAQKCDVYCCCDKVNIMKWANFFHYHAPTFNNVNFPGLMFNN